MILRALIIISVWAALSSIAAAQTPAADSASALVAQAYSELERARADELSLFAPRTFDLAQKAYGEARSLADRNRDSQLVILKARIALDELQAARTQQARVREKLGIVIEARAAARSAGADSLSRTLYDRAETRFTTALRQFERNSGDLRDIDPDGTAGGYRAAKLDALRGRVLSDARERVAELERRGGERMFPTLVLRAQQAVSRAEAALARDDLDAAHAEGQAAVQIARQALALMDFVAAAQKDKNPWESALLPYDDLLEQTASELGGQLDMSSGGLAAGPQLSQLIRSSQDSLRTAAATQKEMRDAMEKSLGEAQTSLVDAQDRIRELEKRLSTSEGDRATARQALERKVETTERMARAQSEFKPSEATVLEDTTGRIIIRLLALEFKSGATNLDKAGQIIVDKAAKAVAQFPGAAIEVQGHTDDEGGEAVNQRLSESRAAAVATHLAAKLQLAPDKIRAVGYGETEPIASNKTSTGRARNRRVDIVLTLP